MANLVNLDSVVVQFDVTPVLDHISVGVDERDRIGVVGLNGAGKSTLLEVIARRRQPDDGRVSWRTGLRVAMVTQSDAINEDATIRDVVAPGSTDAEHTWAANPLAREVIEGLGLATLGLDQQLSTLSGGQRRRVALAAALVSDLDLLILDEPTNHLDIEGIRWLARFLDSYRAAVVVVTHDRWFLDTVCTRTWEVVGGGVRSYDGGYADWIFARAERERVDDATEQRRRNLARKELAWLRRGPPARTSKPRFRIEAAQALIADVPPPRNALALAATAVSRMGKTVVDLDDVGVQVDGRPIISHVTWQLAPGGRYGIVGPNGAGKSTLLNVIRGTLHPTTGSRTIGTTIRIGFLSQLLGELDPSARLIESITESASTIRVGGQEISAAALLERFGFARSAQRQLVGDLSGGQRRRLQLARTLMGEPNLLLMDEPTNDLDVDTLSAFEDLLDDWPGTIVVVSHDRYLLERMCEVQYALVDGRLRHLPGGIDEYLQLRESGPADAASSAQPARSAAPSAAVRREARKTLARLERQMTGLEQRRAQLHQELADQAADYERVSELNAQLAQVESAHAELEDEWLRAAEDAED